MKKALLLTIALNIASVHTSDILPHEVREVTNESLSELKGEPKIIGGTEANDNQFPFMIYMTSFFHSRMSKCSGSLLRPNWVLLAAHCLDDRNIRPWNVFLVGGKANVEDYVDERIKLPLDIPVDEAALGLQERRASALYIHPKYNTHTLVHDSGVIVLRSPFTSPNIKTIPLSTAKMRRQMRCTILGWGRLPGGNSNHKLYYAENTLVSTPKLGCRYKFKGPFICIKTKDHGICVGDSGGPLVCHDRVWAVASHSTEKGCGESLTVEDYYSEIYPDLKWLNDPTSGTAVVSFNTVLLITGFWLIFFINSFMYKI